MKNTLLVTTLVTMLSVNTVFAATGAEAAGISLGGWIFIGFMAVIVLLQTVPSLMMFGSMMASLLGKAESSEEMRKM